jgi:hypothetical protein
MTSQPAEIPLLEGQTSIEDVIEGGDDAVHEAPVRH